MLPATLHNFVALLLASNYFAFQVELFEEEYEKNHRPVSDESSIAAPTLTWESFDKNNAPKAFTLSPIFVPQVLWYLPNSSHLQIPPLLQINPVRDKSPPIPDLD